MNIASSAQTPWALFMSQAMLYLNESFIRRVIDLDESVGEVHEVVGLKSLSVNATGSKIIQDVFEDETTARNHVVSFETILSKVNNQQSTEEGDLSTDGLRPNLFLSLAGGRLVFISVSASFCGDGKWDVSAHLVDDMCTWGKHTKLFYKP
jgi:hypothetical protein